MKQDWLLADKLLSGIRVTSNPKNNPVTIHGSSKDLRVVGVGTDAAVFQYIHKPAYAFKLFADDKRDKIQIEAKVYQELNGSTYFPTFYAATGRYLVLSYESGNTLYNCLLKGIHIPDRVMEEVEKARRYARERNLNPRDIHLKNVIIHDGRAKVIDVSEYMQHGNDFRWEHLKKAYEEFYHVIKGKAVPLWLLEAIRRWYNQRQYESNEEFSKDAKELKMFGNKLLAKRVLPQNY